MMRWRTTIALLSRRIVADRPGQRRIATAAAWNVIALVAMPMRALALTFCVSGAEFVAIQAPSGANRDCRPIVDDAVTMVSVLACRDSDDGMGFVIQRNGEQTEDRLASGNITVRVEVRESSNHLHEQFSIQEAKTEPSGFFIATDPDQPAILRHVSALLTCPAGPRPRPVDIVDPSKPQFEPWRRMMRRLGRWPT